MRYNSIKKGSSTLFHSISRYRSAILILCLLALYGCGNSGINDDTTRTSSATSTGTFIDATVEGLLYQTGDTESLTGVPGTFRFKQGDEIAFYIGDILLGRSVIADTILTPIDLVENGTLDSEEVINIARFLQSLDIDPAADHIKIPMMVHSAAKDLNLSFSSNRFEDEAAEILRYIAESVDDYTSVPTLVSAQDAREHLAASLTTAPDDSIDDNNDNSNDDVTPPGDDDQNTDPGDGDDNGNPQDDNSGNDTPAGGDISDPDNIITDANYGVIVPFSEAVLLGNWVTTITNQHGKQYQFHLRFSSGNTGTITYGLPFGTGHPQDITWSVNNEGRLVYQERNLGITETSIVTRYENGDVVWTTSTGYVVFTADFEKIIAGGDDDDPTDNNTGDTPDVTADFLGNWTVTDTNVDPGQSSQGSWTISEKSGAIQASGQWVAIMEDTPYGDITVTFPFSNATATVDSNILSFSATGTASTKIMFQKLTSGFTIMISNATTDTCEYRISVEDSLWNSILPADAEGWNYRGTATVRID